eukprot:10626960-Lingulodinium_polyedra.AAC.1
MQSWAQLALKCGPSISPDSSWQQGAVAGARRERAGFARGAGVARFRVLSVRATEVSTGNGAKVSRSLAYLAR